jgi:hypothetical protein
MGAMEEYKIEVVNSIFSTILDTPKYTEQIRKAIEDTTTYGKWNVEPDRVSWTNSHIYDILKRPVRV